MRTHHIDACKQAYARIGKARACTSKRTHPHKHTHTHTPSHPHKHTYTNTRTHTNTGNTCNTCSTVQQRSQSFVGADLHAIMDEHGMLNPLVSRQLSVMSHYRSVSGNQMSRPYFQMLCAHLSVAVFTLQSCRDHAHQVLGLMRCPVTLIKRLVVWLASDTHTHTQTHTHKHTHLLQCYSLPNMCVDGCTEFRVGNVLHESSCSG